QAERGQVLGGRRLIKKKSVCLAGVGGIGGEQVGVFLECGAAARSVGDDSVYVVAQHGINVAAGQHAGLFAEAGVRVERPTASLAGRNPDLDAVFLQHANGSAVEFGEGNAGDAAGEEGNASAALSLGGIGFAELTKEKVGLDRRLERVELSHAEKFEHPQ